MIIHQAMRYFLHQPIEEGQHSLRVAHYARLLAEELGMERLAVERIVVGSLLHDFGKQFVPESILRKPGKLAADEFEIVKHHVNFGYVSLLEVPDLHSDSLDIVLHHHEHYDGGGYPLGRSGEDIPIAVRIVSIADAFDAMVTDRIYSEAASRDHALEEIRRCRGHQFDPRLADLFLTVIECSLPMQLNRLKSS